MVGSHEVVPAGNWYFSFPVSFAGDMIPLMARLHEMQRIVVGHLTRGTEQDEKLRTSRALGCVRIRTPDVRVRSGA